MSDEAMWEELDRVFPEMKSVRRRIERRLESMSDEEFISFIEWLIDGDDEDDEDGWVMRN